MPTIDLLRNWTDYPATLQGSRTAREIASPRVAVGGGELIRPAVTYRIDGDVYSGKGDFEGDLSWLGAKPSSFTWDETEFHSGSKSLKMGGTVSGGIQGMYADPVIPVQEGDKFRPTAWVRYSSDFSSTDSKVRLYNATTGAQGLLATVDYTNPTGYASPNEWFLRPYTGSSGILTIGSGITHMGYRIQRNGTDGYVWVDDVRVEQYYSGANNVLLEFWIRAYTHDEVVGEWQFGSYSVTNNVTTTAGDQYAGGVGWRTPAFATSAQIVIKVSDKFNFGTLYLQKPTLLHSYRSPAEVNTYYDRFHFMVEDVHGNILARDAVAMEPMITRVLSGPCEINLKFHPKEPSIQMPGGTGPIQFKPWGHWIHCLKEDLNGNEKIWASGLVQPSDVDPATGILSLRAQGFANYPKGIPWLQNWNPIAVDPGEIVERIWTHLQSYENGNLVVTVTNKNGTTPARTGTMMLPGFSFENENFIQDFFAIFIRAADRNDCGDYINRLARDIPFDYWEDTTWEGGTEPIRKFIRIAYPSGGAIQNALIFRMGENVTAVTPKQPVEVEWFSDITMNGYFPGKVYSSTHSNADPNRYRRTMDEVDLHINSNERSKAWAKRKLTRRQFPDAQFESIVIDPYHPNAPHGSFDVGDIIRIQGPVPWYGDIDIQHKIISHTWDEAKGVVQLGVMAEGAFNYDPIEYVED